MSAINAAAPRTDRPGARNPRAEAARILLRLTLLELRRSPMPLMLPLVAALFWFDGLRTGQGLPAIWTQRASILPDHVMPDVGPIAAGMAAWVGGREKRRGMGDLADSTARPRWLRQLAAWGGATGWTLLAYAACTTVVYVLAARVVTWGGPPVWPVVMVGLTVTVFCTAGFVAGALFPSRFTAPLAAIGTMFVAVLVFQSAVNANSGVLLLSPDNDVPQLDWGVFHPVPPDLSIVQTLFLGGLVVVLLGVLGVLGSVRGAQLRRSAVAVTAVGLAACVAGFALASGATRGGYGYEVPALHDAASDRAIPYTPVCTRGSVIPVCVHPVFSADLPAASAAFAPLLAEVAGLPGAPARATQVDVADLPSPGTAKAKKRSDVDQFGAGTTLATPSGGAPVLEFGYGDLDAFSESFTVSYLRGQAAQLVIGNVIAPNGDPDAAQQAVELALVQRAGGSEGEGQGPLASAPTPAPTPAVAAAAARFAALPPSQSHAWLVTHLSQLRAGQITPGELP
jgi:hypothetical protein